MTCENLRAFFYLLPFLSLTHSSFYFSFCCFAQPRPCLYWVLHPTTRAGDGYERDEDHLAQCIELLGEFPKKVSQTGKYCRNYFTRKGELKHIHNLRFWPLKDVLSEKYRLAPADAESIAAFLVPCLELVPGKRATAASALQSAWLTEPVSL